MQRKNFPKQIWLSTGENSNYIARAYKDKDSVFAWSFVILVTMCCFILFW